MSVSIKLKNTIAKYSQDRRNDWDVKMGELVYAYNTSFQESTKHSPLEAKLHACQLTVIQTTLTLTKSWRYTPNLGALTQNRAGEQQKKEEAVKENIKKSTAKAESIL